jgi:hypothetical protein
MPLAFDFLEGLMQLAIGVGAAFQPFLRQIQYCPPRLSVDNEHLRPITRALNPVS